MLEWRVLLYGVEEMRLKLLCGRPRLYSAGFFVKPGLLGFLHRGLPGKNYVIFLQQRQVMSICGISGRAVSSGERRQGKFLIQTPAIPVGTEENRRLRIRTARFSLGSAVSLCVLKTVTGILSGSMGILASAIDNLVDIVMSGVNLVSITKASYPADESHPYGHGKMETLGTLFQGGVIAVTGVIVALEAVRRLVKGVIPGGPGLDTGIMVMVFSMVASWFISNRIRKAGEDTGSPALIADSVHFRMDIYSGGGVLFSLLLFRFTGWKWLDPAIGMTVGVYIIVSAWPLINGAISDILDKSLPPDTVNSIERLIERHRPVVKDLHRLRTRRSGSEIQVDFHIVMCREQLLGEAHKVADHLEQDIKELLGNAYVISHIDPCNVVCEGSFKCEHMKRMIRELSDAERNELKMEK